MKPGDGLELAFKVAAAAGAAGILGAIAYSYGYLNAFPAPPYALFSLSDLIGIAWPVVGIACGASAMLLATLQGVDAEAAVRHPSNLFMLRFWLPLIDGGYCVMAGSSVVLLGRGEKWEMVRLISCVGFVVILLLEFRILLRNKAAPGLRTIVIFAFSSMYGVFMAGAMGGSWVLTGPALTMVTLHDGSRICTRLVAPAERALVLYDRSRATTTAVRWDDVKALRSGTDCAQTPHPRNSPEPPKQQPSKAPAPPKSAVSTPLSS